MADTPEEREDESLTERLLDLVVFLPTGLVVTIAEELPRLAERGRERLGVQVNSARAVGKFAVTAGGHEFRRRSAARKGPPPSAGAVPPTDTSEAAAPPTTAPPRLRSIPRPPAADGAAVPAAGAPSAAPAPGAAAAGTPVRPPPPPASAGAPAPPAAAPARPAGGHVPDVTTLAIPGFDTLSASQVVQRLDGLSRSELVAVRAYETSTRGRRTILSRVDQLLDERS